MTEAQYKHAKEILEAVKGIDARMQKNEDFLSRLREMDEGYRLIQIADDKWTNIPTAVVSSTNLERFVRGEIHALKLQKKSLMEKFEDI